METDISDVDRIAGNADVLATVEREIVILEGSFTEFAKLEGERDRLTAAIQSLTADETRTLQDDAAESVIVKKLIEIRTRRDVQSARLAAARDKIEQQTAALVIQAESVRRSFARVLAKVWLARQARVGAILNELFGGPIRLQQSGRIELKELIRHTLPMKQLKDADNRLCHPIADPVQETIALQTRTRSWLTELTDLVTSEEPGLVLTVPVRQPIEEPAREMATA
jgi:hypothetical protein